MGKRKEGRERSEDLIFDRNDEEEEAVLEGEDRDEEANGGGFYACYLLCSLCPRYKGHTYIGFTVNPCRRIKQHNGELRSGAWRTKSKRPWEMILCIYGFPTNVTALQFEWAWQNPTVSLAVRKAAANLKSLSGIVGKIKIAYEMLTLPPWDSLKLTVNFFSTKYMKNAAGCRSLPKQMKVKICPMDELPCYKGHGQILDEIDDEYNEDEDDAESVCGGNDAMRETEKQFTPMEENQTKASSEEDDRLRYDIVDSPVQHRDPFTLMEENQTKAASEEDDRLRYDIVDSPLEARDPLKLTEIFSPMKTPPSSSSFGLIPPPKQCSETSIGDNDEPISTKKSFPVSEKVEVIDISTPSSGGMVNLFRRKKRRNNWLSQDIIDLTKSPDSFQL